MTTAKEVFKEVQSLTASLIGVGICMDQNFPTMNESKNYTFIGFPGLERLAIALKNIPYADTYGEFNGRRYFNMRLVDGALVQIQYTFVRDELSKHRLAFFPAPDLLEFQNNRELYEDDELYADIVAKNVVTVPQRFDFDRKAFEEGSHPMSHLTLGQYKNCRIPVSAPMTPFHFLSFIMRAFYNTPFSDLCADIKSSAPRFERTIEGKELDQIYMHACGS